MLASLRSLPLSLLRRLTGRQAVLLAREARDDVGMLVVQAGYRVEGSELAVRVSTDAPGGHRVEAPGCLTAEARAYEGHFPGEVVWRSDAVSLDHGTTALVLDLEQGMLRADAAETGGVPVTMAPNEGVSAEARAAGTPAVLFPGRRFVLDWTLRDCTGRTTRRRTGHYLAAANRPVDASYFGGDTYVDHEAQSAAEHPAIVARVRPLAAPGARVLEVGCATGGLVHALRAAAYDAVGADFSSWAVQRARERLHGPHAFEWNADAAQPPAALVARGPFDVLLLWVTLEHFRAPWAALAALGPLAAPGAHLLIKTTNADSLTHRIFGRDWEGHFDWTHHGVESVGAQSLRAQLPPLGWRILSLTTDQIWDSNADPTHATLRDWHASDARFRQLLAERDLGDLVTVTAVRA